MKHVTVLRLTRPRDKRLNHSTGPLGDNQPKASSHLQTSQERGIMVSTLFFVFIGILVFSICAAGANMASISVENMHDKFSRKFVIHCICAGLASLSGLGAMITGIVWIVGKFSHG